MGKKYKKERKKPGIKRTYIVHSKGPILSIEDYEKEYMDPKTMMRKIIKPTLHAGGGLITGIPKLAKKGWK